MGSIVSLLTQPKPSTKDGTSQPRNLPAALSKELRGKLIHVDMSKSFQNWRSGARHPEYERLRRESDRVLEIGVLDSNRCNKFKKSDFALFSALWWPDAAWEDLYTVMLFTAALFVWDDTIDTNEHTLASDFERAELWRQQSLSYFKYHLQLAPQDVEPYCPDDICLVFKEFAERFCKNFGEEQRHRMFSKIEDFVEHNKLEQIERLTGRIPNYEEYMRIRYGVTGVRMFTLLLEVAQQAILPAWVMDSSEMEEIIEESNYMIIVINDILSLKKEIATDCVVNVVPVLYKSGQPLEEIIPSLTEEMHASRDRLDNTATRLDSMTRNDPQLNKNVMTFIDGIRIMVTGTLEYSIEAPRYGVRQYLNPNGSLDIVL